MVEFLDTLNLFNSQTRASCVIRTKFLKEVKEAVKKKFLFFCILIVYFSISRADHFYFNIFYNFTLTSSIGPLKKVAIFIRFNFSQKYFDLFKLEMII